MAVVRVSRVVVVVVVAAVAVAVVVAADVDRGCKVYSLQVQARLSGQGAVSS